MQRFLRKIADVRDGELKRLLIMTAYIFVIIASYNVLKPMTRSLFVSRLGPGQLPFLYMLLAVVVAVFVLLYLRLSARVKLVRLLNITLVALMLSLLFFRWLLQLNLQSATLYYGLFIWASIYGVLTTSQFWLLANYVFNARAAKRLFPILTSSALAGAIMGGYFTRFLVKSIGGTSNLAFFCLGLLILAQILMNMAWRNRDQAIDKTSRPAAEKDPGTSLAIFGETISIIKNFRHLRFIIAIVALTYIVVQIADFQFIALASEQIHNTDDLTGFLGLWLSNLSIFALVFQLLFAGSILRRFGVGVTIIFLPIALFITSAWVFLSYGMVSILALKVGDGAFRHSINKVGMELLYLPVPQELKKKTKTFIDMFADRFARGLAGLLLLISYTWMGLSVAQISLISLLLILLWLPAAMAAYREYVNSFRQAIARREIDLDTSALSIKDEAAINSLLTSLKSPNERQIVYALQVLESVDGVDLGPSLRPLLQHKSANIRKQTLALIHASRLENLITDAKPLLHDRDEHVRREAVRILVEFSEQGQQLLSQWIKSDDIELKGATLYYLAGLPELAEDLLSPTTVQSFLDQGDRARALVAEAIGLLRNERYYPFLNDLLQDKAVKVRKRAIESAGKISALQFLPVLVQNLRTRTFRKTAREALAGYGDSISAQLTNYLIDPNVDIEIRLSIPRVFSLIGTQRSVNALFSSLTEPDNALRYQLIKALNKLRTNFHDLKFDDRVNYELQQELKAYFRILATIQLCENKAEQVEPDKRLLNRALQERLDDHLERVFRLLGLNYSPGDMYNAFSATTSANSTVKANATEFLDNVLSKKHKQILLPIVEELPVKQVLENAHRIYDTSGMDKKSAITELLRGTDTWLSACALYHIGTHGLLQEYEREIVLAGQSPHLLIRETADFVLKQFA